MDKVSPSPASAPQGREDRALLWALRLAPPAVAAGLFAARLHPWRPLSFFAQIREIYALVTVAWPAVFLAASVVAWFAWRVRRPSRTFRVTAGAYAVLAGAPILFRLYSTHVEPRRLAVRHVSMESERLREPLRILHISDIQSHRIGDYEDRVFAEIRRGAPDLIVFTGDLLQPIAPATWDSEMPRLRALFRSLSPPLGIYGVAGDVDGGASLLGPSTLGGLRFLRSTAADLDWRGTPIRIIGLSLAESRRPRGPSGWVARYLDASGPRGFRIVAGHAPDYVITARRWPVDLCLAGHTHGGQVRLPLLGPPITLSRTPRAWARGFRRIGGTFVNVSAGIGSEHSAGLPAIRFFCRPEMTFITVRPAARPAPAPNATPGPSRP